VEEVCVKGIIFCFYKFAFLAILVLIKIHDVLFFLIDQTAFINYDGIIVDSLKKSARFSLQTEAKLLAES